MANKRQKPPGDNHRENTEGKDPRLANLQPPWPKGVSGNPAGRPKSITLSEAYRKALAKPCPDDPEGRTYAEVIADKVVQAAATGSKYDIAMARELADRIEGKPRQTLDVDLNTADWREIARAQGLSEDDVINEALLLIEQHTAQRDSESGGEEDRG